jgi:DNA-binding transcriptional ArsR family regulator
MIIEQPVAAVNFLLKISTRLYNIQLMHSVSNLDAAFSALADPTRRAILARLAKGEATVMELAAPFEMTQPAISQHLKVLEDAGLVVRRVDGTKRPRRLAKAGVEAVDQWLAMLRNALEKSYDRLDEVLASMEKQKRGEKR